VSAESSNPAEPGWRKAGAARSLSESHASVAVPAGVGFWRKLLAFSGPGFLVAVGYMDPGNWATDLEGGAKFGYTLLSVIMISNLMAILLQHLSVKLGIATGRDLAQACRDHYPRPVVWFLWVLCELAIAACDLVLLLQHRGFRWLEAVVVTLIMTIGGCFAIELFLAKPDLGGIVAGFVPTAEIIRQPAMLFSAIGILGATVMPHNLYLHSSIVQTRKYEQTAGGKREAIKFATIDSTVALMFALFINGAILVLSAAAFHNSGHQDVAQIQDAYHLLDGVLGVTFASVLFAVALLASGQNSTLTGTLAGQIVMEGFIDLRIRPWLRRIITRAIAVVPAVVVIGIYGEGKSTALIVASQVCLSMQLGFACWPLMRFTGERAKMGEFVNPLWINVLGWAVTLAIIALNVKLLLDIAGLTGG